MADIKYIVNQDIPENIDGFEQYSQEDKNLLGSFQINSVFDLEKNYSELHILSLSNELLESDYLYNRHRQLGNAQSAGQTGISVLTIDPIADSKYYGYDGGGIKLLYHFLDDLYTDDNTTREFFIQDISADRTEVLLNSLNATQEELLFYTANIKSKLENQSYFAGFRLNFKSNDLVIAINIDTVDSGTGKVLAVKLYEPLPDIYDIRSTLTVVETVSDSIAYEVDSEYTIQPEQLPTLKPANFNIELADESTTPTGYLNYNELFSYPVSNANNQVYSLVNEKGIDLSIDYSDFNNFIHFSSAQERLLNFKYKVELIDGYHAEIDKTLVAKRGLIAVTGSIKKYEELITGIVNNFDHYERFLYYESGSSSWPKSNNTKPYINEQVNIPGPIQGSTVSNPAVTAWYTNQIENAIYYDNVNNNSLLYSIPVYLRDDENNENYLTFVYMIGQHFDNLWLYSKAVTDKYDADNRPDRGISKDLVAEALKNFGVKLYTSNKSIEDLFTTFTGQGYQSGSEVVNHYITGSLTGSNTPIQPTSYDSYQKEIQKRIYHNLPFLLKTKGTERGLRALINCFGIPSEILKIKQYGGVNTDALPFLGDHKYYTSSLDKVRLDNAGSITKGNTLSDSVSILKNSSKYTTDIHAIEVGFSPTDNIDTFIEKLNSETCARYTIDVRTTSTDTYTYIDCFTGKTTQQTCDVTRTFYAITDSVIYDQDSSNYSLSSEETLTVISDIDTYLGDPNNLNLDNYSGLYTKAEIILEELDTYNLQDYVRLIKFFDNTIFKMIKDFIPARSVATTGIVIKPNLLNISKAKSVSVSVTQPEYTASIDTAFTSGSDGGAFSTTLPRIYEYSYANPSCVRYSINIIGLGSNETYRYIDCLSETEEEYSYNIDRTFYAKLGSLQYDSNLAIVVEQSVPQIGYYTLRGSSQLLDTSYKDVVQTPQGLDTKELNWQTDQPLYTGELSASIVEISNGEWNENNPYKDSTYTFTSTIARSTQDIPTNVCGIPKNPLGPFIVPNSSPYNIAEKFQIPGSTTSVVYTIASESEGPVTITTPTAYAFTQNYKTYTVTASRESGGPECVGSATFVTQFYDANKTSNIPIAIESGIRLDVSSWFNLGVNVSSSYSASYSDFPNTITGIPDEYNYYPKTVSSLLTADVILQDTKVPSFKTIAQTRLYPTAPVAEIGTQDWTSRNLDVATYTDGTPIPQVSNDTQWEELTTGAWCYPDGITANNAIYGKLYNWYALMGIHDDESINNTSKRKQLLPSGWILPSLSDYQTLVSHLETTSLQGGTVFRWDSTNTDGSDGVGDWRMNYLRNSYDFFSIYDESKGLFQNPINRNANYQKQILVRVKASPQNTKPFRFKIQLWTYSLNESTNRAGTEIPACVFESEDWIQLNPGQLSREYKVMAGNATNGSTPEVSLDTYGTLKYEAGSTTSFGHWYGHVMQVRILSEEPGMIYQSNVRLIGKNYSYYYNTPSSWALVTNLYQNSMTQFVAGRESGVINKIVSTNPSLWTRTDTWKGMQNWPNNKSAFGAVTAGWRDMFGNYNNKIPGTVNIDTIYQNWGTKTGWRYTYSKLTPNTNYLTNGIIDLAVQKVAHFWTTSEDGPTAGYAFNLFYSLTTDANWNKHDGNSIRLIRPTTKRVIIGANQTSAATSSLNVPNTSQMFNVYNLDTTKYRDGTTIPQVKDPEEWKYLTTGAWCYYNNNPANNATYGKLYNWYAVNNPRGLAPTGYRIPSEAEWATLVTYLGGEIAAGTKLRANSTLWTTNTGTNSSGFTALPGGYRHADDQEFFTLGRNAIFWSSTSSTTEAAKSLILGSDYTHAYILDEDKAHGASVRLIKDASAWQIG